MVGLIVNDSSGNEIFNTGTYTGKILGIATVTDGVSGDTGTNTKFAWGTPFWVLLPTSYYNARLPTASFASNKISWTWPSGSGGCDFVIIYGVI